VRGLANDARLALRRIGRAPGTALVIVATIGLGLGMVTIIDAVRQGILVRPYAFPAAQRLVAIDAQTQACSWLCGVAPADFLGVRDGARDRLASISAYQGWVAALGGRDVAATVGIARVSPDFFRTLGVQPLLGRWFADGEDTPGAGAVVVLSHAAWTGRFGADRDIVGRRITLDGTPFTVVGVADEEMLFPGGIEMWVPLTTDLLPADDHQSANLGIVARLQPGASIAVAGDAVGRVARTLAQSFPATNAGRRIITAPLGHYVIGPRRSRTDFLGYCAALLLLLATLNTATLSLVQATGRQHEVALRAALGASRWRNARPFLVESLLLALVAGALASTIAAVGAPIVARATPDEFAALIMGWRQIRVGPRQIALAGTIAAVTGIVCGLLPLWAISVAGGDSAALAEGGRGSSGSRRGGRLRGGLIVGQFAFALVLAVNAGLIVHRTERLLRTPLGIRLDGVVTMSLWLPNGRYGTVAERAAFDRRLAERLSITPGVDAAGLVSELPLTRNATTAWISVDGAPPVTPSNAPEAIPHVITPGYLQVLGIPLDRGRSFGAQDTAGAVPVALISRTAAAKLWPGRDPLGHAFTGGGGEGLSAGTHYRVVGIVGDVRVWGLDQPPQPEVYFPVMQAATAWTDVAVHSRSTPAATLAALRQAVHQLDPAVAVSRERTMDQVMAFFNAGVLVYIKFVGSFAVVALLIAAIGIYGVTTYSVTARRREIGVRVALGAQRRDVIRTVTGRSAALVGCGLVLGMPGAYALGRALASTVSEIRPFDPPSFVTALVVLLAAAVVAGVVPVRRALRADPAVVLRSE
jgi:putative ABC transport system permease protein